METNTLFNEKYRPVSLENYVGSSSLKETISKQLEANDIQNYLFWSSWNR